MEKMDNEELTTTFKRGQRHHALDLSLYTVFLALFLYCFFLFPSLMRCSCFDACCCWHMMLLKIFLFVSGTGSDDSYSQGLYQ